jgi:hypothetical protein
VRRFHCFLREKKSKTAFGEKREINIQFNATHKLKIEKQYRKQSQKMLSNLNQQPIDGLNGITNKFHNVNSHSTKNNALEFSIYRPDVDFSVNYEPVGEKKVSRIVNDAKDASAAPKNGENGRRVVVTMSSYDPTSLHNYSKVPQDLTFEGSDSNNNKNTNGVLSDQEDGQRDDNNNPSNKVDDKKPEHHVSHLLHEDCRVVEPASTSFFLCFRCVGR